ncbi:MAG: choice-of-anchor I family protein, partial [Geminicoccaceae bacterium]
MDNGVNGDSAPVASRDVTFSTFAELIGEGGSGASEVVAYENGSFFVTNGENDRIDIFDNPAGTVDGADRTIDLSTLDGYDGVQSVAVKNGVVAAAIARPAEDTTVFGGTDVALSQAGFVALFDANTLALLSTVDVGNLPDQIAFNADGSKLLVAGEGEKNEDSEHDDNPLGTVAIVDTTDPANPSVELLDFTAFNGLEEQARAAGIRIQDGVSFAEDVEPEYTAFAFNDDGAFVSLQENNAIAELSIAESSVVDVFLLGLADFENGSKLDVNDNGVIEIGQFPSLVGFRMPDAIATYEVDGETYIVTANEGDSRGFDEARISDLVEDGLLDPALAQQFRDAGLIDDDPDSDIGIERLEVSSIDGDTDGDGDIDVPHTFSTRSFSIFDEAGNLVFDSGSDFEEFIASIAPERFNDDEGTTDENRSDAKGPEPEAVTVGQI